MEQWNFEQFNETQRQRQVLEILVTAYGNFEDQNTPDGAGPTNMWAIFLRIDEYRSIQLEMSYDQTQPGTDPMLKVKSRNYVGTYNSVKNLTYPTLKQTTVQEVFDLMSANGRHRFRFAFDQEGCRHWAQTILFDMETTGLIAAGSGAAATIDLQRYWHSPAGSGSIPRPIVNGTFY